MQALHPQRSSSRELQDFYARVRHYTETLCEPLETEDYIPQPVVDVSPPKWHIAHTTWFFEEMILKRFVPDYKVFDPNFAFLFNSYYNSVGERIPRAHRGYLSRPTVNEVFGYRKYVDERMLEFLDGDLANEVRDLVVLGLNHEQQHQELLLTDIKWTFSFNPLYPAYKPGFTPIEITETEPVGFVDMTEGIYEIGYSGEDFCFDNELPRHKVYLNDYSICGSLVTNREYFEFIEDGGYGNPNLWHRDGWDWVRQNNVTEPQHWVHREGEVLQFSVGGLRKMWPDAPVCHVSFYEAAAFAEWKGLRLPTEFEWEAAADKFEWGLRWEWTNSAYLPYPGFKKAPGAVGEYNGKFMVNQMVLRGSSVITPPGHSRRTYRNFFQPHLRWQFTGIRLAK